MGCDSWVSTDLEVGSDVDSDGRRRLGVKEKDRPAFFATTLIRPARIEQGIGTLKRFKRVGLRCEKTARNFRSIVSFAAGLCLIKFVQTA